MLKIHRSKESENALKRIDYANFGGRGKFEMICNEDQQSSMYSMNEFQAVMFDYWLGKATSIFIVLAELIWRVSLSLPTIACTCCVLADIVSRRASCHIRSSYIRRKSCIYVYYPCLPLLLVITFSLTPNVCIPLSIRKYLYFPFHFSIDIDRATAKSGINNKQRQTKPSHENGEWCRKIAANYLETRELPETYPCDSRFGYKKNHFIKYKYLIGQMEFRFRELCSG